jgi:hemolysin III
MQLLKYTPGFYCSDCSCRNNHNNNSSHSQNNNNSFNDLLLGSMAESARNNNNNNTIHSPNSTGSSSRRQLLEDQQDLNDDHSCLAEDYDIPALRRQNSATSPLVVAPMMLPNLTTLKHHTVVVERIISEYMVACRFYGATANAGVVTTFRFSLPALRTTGNFGDKDTLALAEIMLHYINGPLRYIKRLDFSKAREGGSKAERIGIRSHGAMALSKVLQKSRFVEEVFLERNHIGPYGASALFIACSTNSSIKHIKLRRCQVGERGAFAFAEWIAPSATCGLGEIDLSANFIGFKGSLAIERAMTARTERTDLEYMHVNLEGNLVLQEVMNGITHGLGALLAFAAIYLLYHSVKDQPSRHFVSCMVYSASLVVLYISSTLYHSFFILQHTKYIFEVLDKCAIYILIAGSYTPFLQIVLWKEAMYSVYLLTFIWVCGFLGICVEAFFPTYRYKQFFSLAMYLGMGKCQQIAIRSVW